MTEDKIRKKVIENMKSLGVYKKEYEDLIVIYSTMLFRLENLNKQINKSEASIVEDYTNKAGATNVRKSALYLSVESLETRILQYSDRLCLNPKAIENITKESTKKSKLEEAMEVMENELDDKKVS